MSSTTSLFRVISKLQPRKIGYWKSSCRWELIPRRLFAVSQQVSEKLCQRPFSSKSNNEDDDLDELDKPVKLSTSKAYHFTAHEAFTGTNPLIIDDTPELAQNWSLALSLLFFMIYFFILREENDWDHNLDFTKPLTETVPLSMFEEPTLEAMRLEHSRNNLDTTAIDKRLKELREQRAKAGQ